MQDNHGAVIDTVEDVFPDDELIAVPAEEVAAAGGSSEERRGQKASGAGTLRRGATFSGRPADLAILPGADAGKRRGDEASATAGNGAERDATARAKLPSDMDKAVTVMRAVTKLQALARTRSARKVRLFAADCSACASMSYPRLSFVGVGWNFSQLYGQLLYDKYLQVR